MRDVAAVVQDCRYQNRWSRPVTHQLYLSLPTLPPKSSYSFLGKSDITQIHFQDQQKYQDQQKDQQKVIEKGFQLFQAPIMFCLPTTPIAPSCTFHAYRADHDRHLQYY